MDQQSIIPGINPISVNCSLLSADYLSFRYHFIKYDVRYCRQKATDIDCIIGRINKNAFYT